MKPGITFLCALMMVGGGCALRQPAIGQASTPANASGPAMGDAKTTTDPFIGKWKLNPSRSRISDEMKVAKVGENKYTFDFGAGSPETIVVDGSDQEGGFGTTLAVSMEGPNLWKVVRKQNGRTLINAMWELSQDGNTLTDHFGRVQHDGSIKTTDYVYQRSAGSAGFSGTWQSTLEQPAFELQIQAYEGDGLAFLLSETTRSLKFDGKDYPASGANLPSGFTSSGHRLNERSLEMTDKVDGKPVDTQHTELSPDLKTLTMTLQNQSQSKPKVYVFERE